MLTDLNFPDQLYVGVKNREAFSIETFPLAFATPYTQDASFNKRKETLESWIGNGKTFKHNIDPVTKLYVATLVSENKNAPVIMANTPLSGFKFEGSVSRWSTSNKWFEINDPRGFTLQISAENLADIILNCTISNGKLEGFFIWGRKGAINYLTRMNHPDYIEHLKPKINYHPVPGDIIETKQDGKLLYLGEYYLKTFEVKTIRGPGYYYGEREKTEFVIKNDNKPFKIFKKVEDSYRKGLYVIYRNFGKHKVVSSGNSYTLPDLKLPFWMRSHSRAASGDVGILFNSKKDMEDFNFTIEDGKNAYKALYPYKSNRLDTDKNFWDLW